MKKLLVGARGSDLSLAQTESIILLLKERLKVECDVVIIRTAGDENLEKPLSGGWEQGIFTRAIEAKLAAGAIDLAVHSLKDLPLTQPAVLAIAACPLRASPEDVLVINSNSYTPEAGSLPLRRGATVGSSSPRRGAQLKLLRSDVASAPLRGNVPTRIKRVRAGEIDAAILALAGLQRLSLASGSEGLVYHPLDPAVFTPAPGQGALAVEMRRDHPQFERVRSALNDEAVEQCVRLERRLLQLFGGGCSLPLGALATLSPQGYHLRGFWSGGAVARYAEAVSPDGETAVQSLYRQLKESK